MHSGQLPLNTWIVVENNYSIDGAELVSQHETQREAETERDRRNHGVNRSRYAACLIVEPVAERMGGQRSPASAALPESFWIHRSPSATSSSFPRTGALLLQMLSGYLAAIRPRR
jgi:hypothetical protein